MLVQAYWIVYRERGAGPAGPAGPAVCESIALLTVRPTWRLEEMQAIAGRCRPSQVIAGQSIAQARNAHPLGQARGWRWPMLPPPSLSMHFLVAHRALNQPRLSSIIYLSTIHCPLSTACCRLVQPRKGVDGRCALHRGHSCPSSSPFRLPWAKLLSGRC